MKKATLDISQPNDAWILHREEIETTQDGSCNIYVLLDAYSNFCFGQEISIDLPPSSKTTELLKKAYARAGSWPKSVIISKKDPLAEMLGAICQGMNIPFESRSENDLAPHVRTFRVSFKQFKSKAPSRDEPPASTEEQAELEAFIPESYGPCPCASGKKFKFCCQKAFKDITFAMCAAQEGNLEEALAYIKRAEAKIGRTAEIACRIGIVWSFFDPRKSQIYLNEALALNPNHPRTNYILGIEAVANDQFQDAVGYYKTAIEHYPPEDKYHLNETYNNLGTAFYELKKYKEAKEAWEKALVLLPTDRMVKTNLYEFIYENPAVPGAVREISPFIGKFLKQ